VKILYLGRYNTSEELSGPEKVAKRIFSQSSKENETAFLEYFFDGSVYGIGKKLFGHEVAYTGKNAKVYRLGLLKIITFIFRFKPQIIHIITFERFSIFAFLYKIFSKIKIIYSVHGIAVYENENFKDVSVWLRLKDHYCEKLFMRLSDKLLFLSEYQLSIAKKYYDIDTKKTEFVNNGVDEEFHSSGRSENQNGHALVFMGDSERKDKDFHFLYKTLDKITQKCDLYIIGNFNHSIYKTGIGNVTVIPITKMDKYSLVKFLSDKSIFISSSFYDTFSIAAAECMVSGLVPVVTDHTGISKLISDGTNGFIIKHNDGINLAGKINLLLENETLQNEMAEKAKHIYELLNWKNVYFSYQKIYNNLS
jgi:glycosyltransferase involved in cell wall biosynthesis